MNKLEREIVRKKLTDFEYAFNSIVKITDFGKDMKDGRFSNFFWNVFEKTNENQRNYIGENNTLDSLKHILLFEADELCNTESDYLEYALAVYANYLIKDLSQYLCSVTDDLNLN